MFERYTEKARRAIVTAKHAAHNSDIPKIETEHVLIGLLCEDPDLIARFLPLRNSRQSLYDRLRRIDREREKLLPVTDLPLSQECRRVLVCAAEEAERLNDRHIGTEHLLCGLLLEQDCIAGKILREYEFDLDKVREDIGQDKGTR